MGRVFILGAGASSFAGYPLGSALWAFIRDHRMGDMVGEQRRDVVIKEMNRVLTRFPPDKYDEPDLEGLFTLFDLTTLFPGHIELLHADWNILKPKVIGTITDAFLSYQHDLQRFLSGSIELPPAVDALGQRLVSASLVKQVMAAWPARLRDGDILLSFNWDLIHEVMMYQAKKWMPSDGYGFVCPPSLNAKPSPVKLLKLHGSVNWAQQNDPVRDPVVLQKAEFFPDAPYESSEDYMREGGWDSGRRLVIPTYIKTINTAFLFRLWDQAANALRSASEVTVIGYSLQPADSLARYLLGTSLLQNEKKPTIRIISNARAEYWDEFLRSLGLQFTPVKKKFEEWVIEQA
jgi:hypothetical protein